MMMKKRSVIFLIIFGIIMILELSSCVMRGCGGAVSDLLILKYKNISFKNSDSLAVDDTVSLQHLNVLYEYRLLLFPEEVWHVKNAGQQKYFSMFPTALACSPPEPRVINPIVSIEIYCDQDLTDEIQAGEDLSDQFLGQTGHFEYSPQVDFQFIPRFDPADLLAGYKTFRMVVHFSNMTTQTFVFNRVYLAQ